ncbi:MAG: DEAD/DEAH box helicase, partial [Candidatus Zixiibacteriota bacterium]
MFDLENKSFKSYIDIDAPASEVQRGVFSHLTDQTRQANLSSGFSGFSFKPEISRALDKIGYQVPTPIQEQAMPVIMDGRDLVATAQTGTGKTAAYLLPIIQRLEPTRKANCEALVLAPTRELALQIGKNLTDFSQYTGHRHTVAYGGSSVREGREALRESAQIVVATPGRLLDYLRQGALTFKLLKFVVLDEADRMLDMGFIPDIRRIMRRTPRSRQTLLFSATFPDPIAYLAREFLSDPARVAIGMVAPAEGIAQKVFPCDPHKKLELLMHLLKEYHWESALIFTRTKRHADAVARRLKNQKYSVTLI